MLYNEILNNFKPAEVKLWVQIAYFFLLLPQDPSGDFTFSQRKAADAIVRITPADTQDSYRPFQRIFVCYGTNVRLLNDIQLLTLLNLLFKLHSRRSGIRNRCWDRLEGWRLSVNGPGLCLRSAMEEEKSGRWTVLSMRVTEK